MKPEVPTSVNTMLNRNVPVQLISNSLYMILNTKTGIVCQPVQKKWSLKDTAWLLIISIHITHKHIHYSNLLQLSSRDHPWANELTCQRRQPLPDTDPLLNISLQSLHVVSHITHDYSYYASLRINTHITQFYSSRAPGAQFGRLKANIQFFLY